MGDRLIVLDRGRIGQFGTPDEIYNRPATPNVARFLNRYNVFDGSGDGDSFVTPYGRFALSTRISSKKPAYAIRYDRIGAKASGSGGVAPGLAAVYVASEYLGSSIVHFFEAFDRRVVEVEHHLSNGPPESYSPGETYDLHWKAEDGIAFV